MLEYNENKSDSLTLLLDEINSTIFSKESWIDNEFYKIPEITYSYLKIWEDWKDWKDFIVNKTLFVDLWWMDIEEFKNADLEWKIILIKNISNKIKQKIEQQISKIQIYVNKMEDISSWNDKILESRKEIILWWLKENVFYLSLALKWLIFEDEKAINWIYFKCKNKDKDFLIWEQQRKILLKEIDKLNTKIFWEEISKNTDYIKWVLII
jgi:hypothetical protein